MALHPYTNEWWLWKQDNGTSLDPVTLKAPAEQREYLENRLHRAFMCGLNAGVKLRNDEIMVRVREFLIG